MPQIELYENKYLRDPELPIQLVISPKGYPNHWHEHLELHYIIEGEADFRLNQVVYHASPGDFIIINPSELHAIRQTKEPYCARVIIFNMADLSQELAGHNYIYQSYIQNDSTVDRLTASIFYEYHRKADYWKQQAKALVLELLVYLCRNYVSHSLALKESERRKKCLDRLNLVLCYIEEHYSESISTSQLAQMVYLSEDRFSHLFRDGVGKSPTQYINDLRLKKAVALLTTQEYTVTEIAEAVGFRDYNHFGRQFRKRYGCTPSSVKLGKASPEDNNSGIV